MGSKVGLGDIRGLLVDADKRPVLRLLPQMDEVSRGYALSHLGGDGCSIEDIASQVWTLNVTDWLREQKKISRDLCKDLDLSGFDMALHEFALRIAEDLFNHEKKGWKVSKESWDLLDIKRRWIKGEVSDEELREAKDAYRVGASAASWAVYGAAYWAAYRVAYHAAYSAADRKRQLELLADILEDSVGIQRGVEEKSLESKVLAGGL